MKNDILVIKKSLLVRLMPLPLKMADWHVKHSSKMVVI